LHDRIEEIRFRAQGCVPLIACASVLTELAAGQTVSTARTLQYAHITEVLGGLPSASTHAGHLAIKALVQALNQATLKKTPAARLSTQT
jgi:NifU-like protein involved in Fe-S cluster formation